MKNIAKYSLVKRLVDFFRAQILVRQPATILKIMFLTVWPTELHNSWSTDIFRPRNSFSYQFHDLTYFQYGGRCNLKNSFSTVWPSMLSDLWFVGVFRGAELIYSVSLMIRRRHFENKVFIHLVQSAIVWFMWCLGQAFTIWYQFHNYT